MTQSQSKPRVRSLYDLAEGANLRLRHSAVACWYRGHEDIKAAVKLFKACTAGSLPKNPARFIRTWVGVLASTFSLATPTRPGRPPSLSKDEVERALQLLWRGYKTGDQRRYYRTIEQAVKRCRELAALCDKRGIKPRTLLLRLQAAEPACRRRLQVVKRRLSAEIRQQRRDACDKLLLWPLEQLRRTFWLDAATVYIVPKSMMVFAPPGAHLVLVDDRLPSHTSQLQKLRFYICINAILGPVALKFVTGTSDEEAMWVTAKGEPAKGCTAEEWESVMLHFKKVVARATESDTWRQAAGRHRPWWSFDNDKIHQNRLRLAYLQINANNRFPLPPNSPDMHRVVERCIARLKRAFQAWLYDNPDKCTMPDYRAGLQMLFKTTQTADVIDADVANLPSLWPAILRAKGDRPPKREL